jgi:hypothetical protein
VLRPLETRRDDDRLWPSGPAAWARRRPRPLRAGRPSTPGEVSRRRLGGTPGSEWSAEATARGGSRRLDRRAGAPCHPARCHAGGRTHARGNIGHADSPCAATLVPIGPHLALGPRRSEPWPHTAPSTGSWPVSWPSGSRPWGRRGGPYPQSAGEGPRAGP